MEHTMARDRHGYIFQDKKGAWYARTTITDVAGRRRNVKRRARDKRDARIILRTILRELEKGSQSVDHATLSFSDLANFYDENYCRPAEYIDGRKVSGLRDVQRAQSALVRFREYFGKRRLREIIFAWCSLSLKPISRRFPSWCAVMPVLIIPNLMRLATPLPSGFSEGRQRRSHVALIKT
jgi:hypothetical protein